MKTVDQKRVKKLIRDLIEDKEVIGFEMVELPDGSEKSFTFFYSDKEVDEMTLKDYENWANNQKSPVPIGTTRAFIEPHVVNTLLNATEVSIDNFEPVS